MTPRTFRDVNMPEDCGENARFSLVEAAILDICDRLAVLENSGKIRRRSPRRLTARQILTNRLGRDLGAITAMPRDLRRALYRLALQLNREGRK